MKLTTEFVKSIKPLKADEEYLDGDGLFLIVKSTGHKVWVYKYRQQGANHVCYLGDFPKKTLELARDLRDAAKLLVKHNVDFPQNQLHPENKLQLNFKRRLAKIHKPNPDLFRPNPDLNLQLLDISI